MKAFLIIELRTRAAHIAGLRINPDGEWMKQVARELLDPADGFTRNATHLIHDRDPVLSRNSSGRDFRTICGARTDWKSDRSAGILRAYQCSQ